MVRAQRARCKRAVVARSLHPLRCRGVPLAAIFRRMRAAFLAPVLGLTLLACASPPTPVDGGRTDGGNGACPTTTARPTGGATWCSMGSDVAGLTVPDGFCLREYGQVPNVRSMAIAPNGDVLVASPSVVSPAGVGGGMGAVVVLPDDNGDGRADSVLTFATGANSVHQLALGGGNLYFTAETTVFRTPYATCQRAETANGRQDLSLPPLYQTGGRWTHGLGRSQAGALYTSRGEYPQCGAPRTGEIYALSDTGTLSTVAHGFRNPMYVRCHFRDEVCMATELGEDGNAANGAVEKLVLFGQGNRNFGLPACHDANRPRNDACGGMSCTGVDAAELSFPLEDTPFGFDWEHGVWPAPYRNGIFAALHGSFYRPYQGAGIVFLPADETTHRPTGQRQTFVQGFGNPATRDERPSDVLFHPDGRLFFSSDRGGRIYWIAPTTLTIPR